MPMELVVPLSVLGFSAPLVVALVALVKARDQQPKKLSPNQGIGAIIAYVISITIFVSIAVVADNAIESDDFGAYWVFGAILGIASAIMVLVAVFGED